MKNEKFRFAYRRNLALRHKSSFCESEYEKLVATLRNFFVSCSQQIFVRGSQYLANKRKISEQGALRRDKSNFGSVSLFFRGCL